MERLERACYIGGSDIAAIMGLDNYRTALDVYNAKVNPEDFKPNSTNKKLDVGTKIEKFIAEMYQTEKKAYAVKEHPAKIIHPKYPFLGGHIDRMVYMDEDNTNFLENQRILECKNTGGFGSKILWEDGLPTYYFAQVQFYLMLTGLKYADVAVLKDGWDFQIIEVDRDDDFIYEMEQSAVDFWNNNIQLKLPPEAVSLEDLKSMYPTTTVGKVLEVTKDIEVSIRELSDIKLQIKDLKKKEETLEFNVKKYVEDSEKLMFNGEVLATYRQNKDTLDTDYRKLVEDLNIQEGVLINYRKVKRGPRVLKIK